MALEIISMDLLRTTPGSSNQLCYLLGYRTLGDGGGGLFYWDTSNPSLVEDGGIVVGTSNTGKWVRMFEGDISVRWFGAWGNGTTDDTAFIQKSIDTALAKTKNVFIPSGTYITSSLHINIPNGDVSFALRGNGKKSTILQKDATTTPILLLNSHPYLDANCEISNIAFKDTGIKADGIQLNPSARFTILQCSFNNLNRSIYSTGALIYDIHHCEFKNCYYGLLIRDGIMGQTNVHANLIEIKNCVFGFIFKWAVDMGGGSMLKLENNDFEENGHLIDTDSGCVMIRNTVYGEVVEAVININRCWFERNHGWDIIAEPNQITIFNLTQCTLALNSVGRAINIQGGKKANILGTMIQNDSAVNINCTTSLIQASSIEKLNDLSSYKTHINVTTTGASVNPNGGASFGQGMSVTNGLIIADANKDALSFSFDNPNQFIHKIKPNPQDNGLLVELQGGSFTVASDVQAMGNLQCHNSSWNTSHLVLGFYHIWIDSTGKLRMKGGQPVSDNDGVIIGTQL